MILVDTSIWIDHFRETDPKLATLLDDGQIITHPFVIGEVALGHLPRRFPILQMLRRLRRVAIVPEADFLRSIDDNVMVGKGLGFVDIHLLASTRLSLGTVLWLKDKRLNGEALRLSIPIETET